MLLQKVNHESDKPGSRGLFIVLLYILSLVVAFMLGYYEHGKTHPSVAESSPDAAAATPAPVTAADEAASVPLSTSASTPASEMIGAAATPVRIEKAVVVSPASAPASSTIPAPAPLTSSPVPPVKQANQITITEPVAIPVKDDSGKITGYINLQKGQPVTPVDIENDQIKIKSGKGFVMVPIKSTDMAH
jgi:hypothetical protein